MGKCRFKDTWLEDVRFPSWLASVANPDEARCRWRSPTKTGSPVFSTDSPTNRPTKRKWDDSCLDDTFETPAKPYIPTTVSPDLGLGCDSFDLHTPITFSQQLPLGRQKAIRIENKDAVADVKSHLNLESCVLSDEVGSIHTGIVFDFNIDSILCLSPIMCNTERHIGADNNVEGCLCPRSNGPGTQEEPSQPLSKPQVHTASLIGNWDVPSKSSAPPGPSRAVVEALEGEADEAIGAPIFESTLLCPDPADEDRVTVKSLVVGNSKAPSGTSPALPQQSQRPVVFSSERDWNNKKRLYMDSVTRHIQENPGPDTAMTELLNLMGHVAQQQQGKRWQHPSDLTTRNYQKRFGNVTTRLSLAEWKAQNSRRHRGFNNVPKIFPRSPIP
ncbi:S100P-binding protein [Merluccius polli]|uniref:S100P-binding protein n=1 Tax=Merluccius polli TaxID=89951 RepID=A0AA47N5M1_MERPO|nr:S100P-binding protein [Merluccius polli]